MKRRSFIQLLTAVLSTLPRLNTAVGDWFAPKHTMADVYDTSAARVICLGLDGMDPQLLRRYLDEGVLPHFQQLAAAGDFRVCQTSVPPQSPVAWSNFITGQDPGGHGIFDFIHRDPGTLLPKLSLAEARPPTRFFEIGKWKFPRDGGHVELLRRGRAFWEYLADAGVDVTVFKMPSNYPPVPSNVRSLSGMGTPDILGTYGIFSYFTDSPPAQTDIGGGRIVPVTLRNQRFTAELSGPPNQYRQGNPASSVPFEVVVDVEHPAATITIGDRRLLLQQGEWSDWVTVEFPMVPLLKNISGTCRFYLMEAHPAFRLYVTPIQIDPRNPVMPISTPDDYACELADNVGPFYTQGLPDDTKALDEGIFDDDDYVGQANLVLDERLRQYRYELKRFRSFERAFLFFYFNSLDQNCHMFWRNMDRDSPLHGECGGRHEDRIRDLYIAMDDVVGQAMDLLDDRTTLFVVSDHGFAPYRRSFHLNRWLFDHGYMNIKVRKQRRDVSYLDGVDWRRTRAYGLGINGLYLNRRGRERYGLVRPGAEAETLVSELVTELEKVVDPQTGERIFAHVYRADHEYSGAYAHEAPDIILGYRRGYRGSNESALGQIADTTFADNRLKWSGDHCMAADQVPGVLLCNRKLAVTDPSLLDLAPTFLHLFGCSPAPDMRGRDVLSARDANRKEYS